MSGYFYYNHDEVPHVKHVGGKAGNLATLSGNGLNVPLWAGITTSFFEEFMGGDLKKIDLLLSETRLNQKNIPKLSEKIIKLVLSRKISAKLKQETELMLNRVFGGTGNRYFSIRSSAVDEDSIQYSFAGQLESFLYVPYGAGFYGYIKKCFASAFSARVMLYRYNNTIPLKGVRPAVIIQEMIFGDVSGVVFTGNPINNNPDQILINAAYGIGEGVVSGELDTDMWVLDRKNTIVRYNPANKREMITFDSQKGTGTQKRDVEERLRDVPSIDDETVKEIAMTARRIEKLFGMVHQDIEWCLKDGIVYILQSRPVTTFSHIDRSSPRTIFDNSNIIESFSGVTSPLTFSFAVTMYDAVYRQFYELMGTNSGKIEELAEVFRNMLAYINGRVYYNLNSWFITLQLLPGYNLNKEFMENMMGVKNPVDIEKNQSISTARKIFIELPGAIKGIATVIYHLVTLDGKIQKFIENFNKVTGPYLDDKFENRSNYELIRLYNLFIRKILKDWKAPIINDLYTMVFFGILTKLIKKLDIIENANLQNDLLSGEGDIESTKPTREIIMISSWIRERKDLAELFARKSEKDLIRMLLNAGEEQYSEIRKIIIGYISRFGFRCKNELKLEESSLKEDPSFLFTTLKNYLKRDPIDLKELERREKEIRRKAEDLVYARIGFVKRAFFKIVLKNTRKAIKNREELRFMRTKIFGIERGLFNRIGFNFKRDGIIDKPEDIYFLHVNEIFELIEGRSVNNSITKNIISLRKNRNSRYLAMETPERMYFWGDICKTNYVEILPDEDIVPAGEDDAPDVFRGVPCSPGMVEGTVKIVHSPRDARLNGEILVAKRTDPGWVPLFPSVSGILIERGSVLSHSAVVAREMGIPTIVGLRRITEKLSDHDRIRINGSTGIVEKLE